MNFKVIIHVAEEGGFWAEVPSVPGCVSQGETIEELKDNIQEAIQGCMSVDLDEFELASSDKIMELAL